MNYFKLILLLFVSNLAYCQQSTLPLDELKQATYFDKATSQLSQAELYKAAQNWITAAFGNYENAVTKQEPQSGLLVIYTYAPVSTSLYDYVRFDMTIVCKENQYEARISKLDGTSQHRTPARLGIKNNDLIAEKEMIVKTETNRKKRVEAEEALESAKTDNENINNAMYKVLASLKEYIVGQK